MGNGFSLYGRCILEALTSQQEQQLSSLKTIIGLQEKALNENNDDTEEVSE